jgi:hypothetical protein
VGQTLTVVLPDGGGGGGGGGDVVSAAAGGSHETGHTLVATRSGEVYAWGCDRWCQLGLGAATSGTVGSGGATVAVV